MTVHELVPILQMAVGPAILVSGVGLLLLSMTNRLGRIVDRSRETTAEMRGAAADEREHLAAELRILLRRARIVRAAIALASLSVLLAAVLIMVLFLTALFGLATAPLLVAVFGSCLALLIASLLLFIRDVNLSLLALRLDVTRSGERSAP